MFDQVTIRVSDREASERFYDTVLRTLGVERTASGKSSAEWKEFSLAAASEDKSVTRRLHVGFGAPSRAHVDDFWRAGTHAGYRDDGPPGERPQYSADYYGAFLLDPDGNSMEAVHHRWVRASCIVSHVWIRVADLAASKQFYERVAASARLRPGTDTPERVQFRGDDGSFSFVPGEPTANVHLGFPATEAATMHDPDGNEVTLRP